MPAKKRPASDRYRIVYQGKQSYHSHGVVIEAIEAVPVTQPLLHVVRHCRGYQDAVKGTPQDPQKSSIETFHGQFHFSAFLEVKNHAVCCHALILKSFLRLVFRVARIQDNIVLFGLDEN